RSSLGALFRVPGLEQLAQQRIDVSLRLDHLARLREIGRGALRTPTQHPVLGLQRMRRLPPPRPPERLQRTSVPLLAPLTQDRRIQPLPAQQRPDLARLRTYLSLTQHPQLVLGREPTPLRALNKLRARHPRRPPARRSTQLAYGSLHSTAAGGSIQLQVQHPQKTPISPSGSVITRKRTSQRILAERGGRETAPARSRRSY